MDEFKLLVFYKAALTGSFSQAASELYISQPAVTKQIRSMERDLGTKLFDRTPKGIFLTPAGKILLEHARAILPQYRKLRNDMSLLSEEFYGELIIGASTTAAQYILPPLLSRFQQTNPSLKLTLINGNTQTIETLLQNKDIDLGIIEGLPSTGKFHYTLFLKDELVFISHRSSRYSQLETISLEELKGIGLVLREKGSGTLEVFESFLSKHNTHISDLKVLIQLGSTESIKLYLKHSDALGVVSIQAITDQLLNNEFKIIELMEGRIHRNFYFIQPEGEPEKLVNTFMSFLKNSL